MAVTTEPKGNLVTPVGFNPDGELRPLNVDADGNLLVSSVGAGVTDVKARAYLSELQSIPSLTWTKVTLDTESYDTGEDFDTVNHKFVCPVAGYYYIGYGAVVADIGDGKLFYWVVRINNVLTNSSMVSAGVAGDLGGANSDIMYCSAGDYIEFFVYHDHGSNRSIHPGPSYAHLTVVLIAE